MPITVPHTALPDLQTAVTTTLLANSTFTNLVTGLFDPAPANQAFPYVTFGRHQEKMWYQFGNTGRQVAFVFDIWSHQSDAEAYSILNAIIGALETQTLTLTNFNMVQNGFLFDGAIKPPNDVQGVILVEATFKTWLTAK